MKLIMAICTVFIGNFAQAQSQPLMTVITDGNRPFAEGTMTGYIVQVDGLTLCTDPYVIGRYISCLPTITVDGQTWTVEKTGQVWAETNGMLGGMMILDNAGRPACSDPMTSIQFRGPDSYVYCHRS